MSTQTYRHNLNRIPSKTNKNWDKNGRNAPKPQIHFAERRFSEHPHVAIIGGGAAGLACAQELADRSITSVVFDTGEHGVGGRMATRSSCDGSLPLGLSTDNPSGIIFDHAAQYMTVSNDKFSCVVNEWEHEGVVEVWNGPVGIITKDRQYVSLDPSTSGSSRYVAGGGFRALAEHMAQKLVQNGLTEIRRPQWINSVVHTPDGWVLKGKGGASERAFDAVVIAHNGKCANRLACPMGSPKVHTMLKKLRLSANWVVIVAFSENVSNHRGFEGVFIEDDGVLAWAGNNTRKLRLTTNGPECWTLISTQKYGRDNKVPQEAVPPAVSERVIREMLQSFSDVLNCSLPEPVLTKSQLWGAALPMNSPLVPCIWDGSARVGVAGDWVIGEGSIENAVLSGIAMAQKIAECRGLEQTDDSSVGLDIEFHKLMAGDIGFNLRNLLGHQ